MPSSEMHDFTADFTDSRTTLRVGHESNAYKTAKVPNSCPS
jgi:hypothetical protein